MLVITEFSEACEGIRKNLMDDKLTHRKMEEVEMADAFIRLLDFAGGFGLDVFEVEYQEMFFDNIPTNKAEALLMLCGLVMRCSEGYAAKEVSILLSAIREYCRLHGLDLMGAMHEKLAFNATREDHTHEARAKEGGKKF